MDTLPRGSDAVLVHLIAITMYQLRLLVRSRQAPRLIVRFVRAT